MSHKIESGSKTQSKNVKNQNCQNNTFINSSEALSRLCFVEIEYNVKSIENSMPRVLIFKKKITSQKRESQDFRCFNLTLNISYITNTINQTLFLECIQPTKKQFLKNLYNTPINLTLITH